MRALSHGLGVSKFPWRRVTDTREKDSPLPVYNPRVEGWRRGLKKPRVGSNRTNGSKRVSVPSRYSWDWSSSQAIVKLRFTHPIRVIFHLDTTRSKIVTRG
ncbi:hypothetical protein CRG98_014168 [Punica granatum]|uniref:Uncharacterized protein n=1 Tax=Punica granatum TaxID=22663 RepID=A0A2I0KA55_PUNGR|nr:hypothetical protein CRG98_014168 [Punica granatum]